MKRKERYFCKVYDDTYKEILRYVVIKTSDSDAISDIMQEIYLKFFQRICKKGYRDIREPIAFLKTLANHELALFYKEKEERIHNVPIEEVEIDAGVEVEYEVENKEKIQAVWEIIRKQPLESYQVFVLRYMYDLSMEEIAEQLGLTVPSVKCRLYRVRQLIRNEMKGDKL